VSVVEGPRLVSEDERLVALGKLELMLTPPEERFDRITRLAREVFGVPVAEINLIGESVQFTKSPQAPGDDPLSVRSESFCDVTIQSPDTLVVTDATRDDRFARRTTVTGERHIRFYAGRPLAVGDGARVGTLCLVDTEPREFDAEQRHLLDEMGVWVERELLESADRDRAGMVQQRLLPASPAARSAVTIAGASIPYHHVGGDFHSWTATDDTVDVTIADVMGKGVGAAIVAATVRATIRTQAALSPLDALRQTNDRLLDDFSATDTFATMFHARLDLATGDLDYADAGHGLSVIVRHGGGHERLVSTGMPIGIAADVSFLSGRARLEPGDLLVTFTDGLLDLIDGTLASVDRVVDIVRASDGVEDMVERVAALCRTTEPTDDVTVVVLALAPRG
jgi:sigma-B regulation protein RsbU (phosphoserine phosphatase)